MVVSNTSPIMNLAVIGQLDLVPSLYSHVLIPDEVADELAAIQSVRPLGIEVADLHWLETAPVSDAALLASLRSQLHAGEAAAIALAVERRPDLLLMDERRGRRLAGEMGLTCVGVLGTLLEAKQAGLVSAVGPLLDALVGDAGFWISRDLRTRVLREAGE